MGDVVVVNLPQSYYVLNEFGSGVYTSFNDVKCYINFEDKDEE